MARVSARSPARKRPSAKKKPARPRRAPSTTPDAPDSALAKSVLERHGIPLRVIQGGLPQTAALLSEAREVRAGDPAARVAWRTVAALSPKINGATPAANEASAPASAPQPTPRASPLETLGIPAVDGWNVNKLDVLSVAELRAVTFDIGEVDPALSMMVHVHNDLLALDLALRSEELMLTNESVSRLLNRIGKTALVAGELHRRVLRAARFG